MTFYFVMSPGSRVVLGPWHLLRKCFWMIDYNYQMAPSPIVPSGTTNILHFIPRFLLQLRYSSCLNVLKCDLKQGKILLIISFLIPLFIKYLPRTYYISDTVGGLASPKQSVAPSLVRGRVNTVRQMIVTWKSYSGSAPQWTGQTGIWRK